MKILLVDDSLDIGAIVKHSLQPYEVEQVLTVQSGLVALTKNNYDLALMDVGLPDGDGFEMCSKIANQPEFSHLPIIFLSAHAKTADKVFGLNCGAVDYLTKPFESTELKARVDSQLRQAKRMRSNYLRTPFFELDFSFQKCLLIEAGRKRDIGLTPTEFRILRAFMENRDLALTRDEIAAMIWSAQGVTIEKKGLDTHVAHLRKKMGRFGKAIVSVYGKGYSLQLPK